jgi:hypothetical protein
MTYKEDMLANQHSPVPNNTFGEIITNLYSIKKKNKRVGKIFTKVYCGLKWRTNLNTFTLTEEHLRQAVPNGLLKSTPESFTILIPSRHFVNGHELYREVTLFQDGKWSVTIGGQVIDILNLGFTTTFHVCTVKDLLKTVAILPFCHGKERPHVVTVSQLMTEEWMIPGNENALHRIRTPHCKRVVGLISHITDDLPSCRNCQLMSICKPSKGNIILDKEDDEDMAKIMDRILPHAPPECKILLQDQKTAHDAKSSTGHRWSKEVIQLCLSIYTRSPGSYKDLRSGGFLKLPSGRLLSMYKNTIPQEAGITQDTVTWMYREFERLKLPPTAQIGGILLDEMSIQPDLHMSKSVNGYKLVGFVTLGKEADMLRNLKSGKMSQTLATHVLQLQFLGLTGFRFPLSHYPTHGATATEIHLIFCQAVAMLQNYGFRILYTSIDGAVTNRQFLKINFPLKSAKECSYVSVNSVFPDQRVAFIMDYSHCCKKIRNSLLSSVEGKGGTRKMESTSGQPIWWKYWEEAYSWDTSSPIQIHKKLTREHVVLDNASKMRNHLAEQVLDTDMLNLMLNFKVSLGNQGSRLDAVIDLLQYTSILVSIFRDIRPITNIEDQRLIDLTRVLSWFLEWERSIRMKYTAASEINMRLMSDESRQDLESCIIGFQQLVILVQCKHPGLSIVPARLNSDAIENLFCQQRGECVFNNASHHVQRSPDKIPSTPTLS